MKFKVETVSIAKVKANPANPRIIKNDKYKMLVKSLRDFPDMLRLRELVVDENMVVLGGNMRLKALREIGEKQVVVKIVDGLSEAQKKEFIIKDNAGFGEWDFDTLANLWSDLPLADWGVDLPEDWMQQPEEIQDAEPQMDKAEELREKWGVKTGNMYGLGAFTVCPKCGKIHDL